MKELVENSIGAELPRSQLRFKGGLELIRVQDNGSGIARAIWAGLSPTPPVR